jgi:hypothetical protein
LLTAVLAIALPFLLVFGFAPEAAAFNGFIDPNGDGAVGSSWASTGSSFYTEIDEAVRQPSTPSTSDNISILNNNKTDNAFIQMTTLSNVQAVSSVTVWIYHNDGSNGTTYVQLYNAAESSNFGSEASFTPRSSNAWGSVTINSLSLSQSDLDGLKLRFRVAKTGGGGPSTHSIYAAYADVTYTSSGSLSADIVNSGGTPVSSPSVSFGSAQFMFVCQISSGTLGVSSERIRVNNTTPNGNWTLTMAATSGATAAWGTAYDFNDGGGSPAGCADGGDADGRAGQLTIDPSVSTLAPQSGCSSSGVTRGGSSAFAEGSVNSITLLTASGSQTNCYYDLTGVSLSQRIPEETPVGNYSINMTITVTAN